MRTKLLGTAAAIGGLLFLAGSAHALTLEIQLQQLGFNAQGPTLEATSTTGNAFFVGSYGNFNLNDVVAESFPNVALGTLSTTELNSSITSSGCASTCTLQIWITETGVTVPPGPDATYHSSLTWNSETGNTPGPNNGTGVEFTNYVDPTNTPFGTTDQLVDATGFQSVENGPAGYNDMVTNLTYGPGGYSLTAVIGVTCLGGACSFNDSDEISLVVPEPASASLLGGALLAVGVWRRRRQARKA